MILPPLPLLLPHLTQKETTASASPPLPSQTARARTPTFPAIAPANTFPPKARRPSIPVPAWFAATRLQLDSHARGERTYRGRESGTQGRGRVIPLLLRTANPLLRSSILLLRTANPLQRTQQQGCDPASVHRPYPIVSERCGKGELGTQRVHPERGRGRGRGVDVEEALVLGGELGDPAWGEGTGVGVHREVRAGEGGRGGEKGLREGGRAGLEQRGPVVWAVKGGGSGVGKRFSPAQRY